VTEHFDGLVGCIRRHDRHGLQAIPKTCVGLRVVRVERARRGDAQGRVVEAHHGEPVRRVGNRDVDADLIEALVQQPGQHRGRAIERGGGAVVVVELLREQWREFASEHDRCLEPVLELDEVLDSELVAAREMVVELAQPGAEQPVKLLGAPAKLSRTPADPARAAGPALGEHTEQVLRAAGYEPEEIATLHEAGAVAGPAGAVQGSFMSG